MTSSDVRDERYTNLSPCVALLSLCALQANLLDLRQRSQSVSQRLVQCLASGCLGRLGFLFCMLAALLVHVYVFLEFESRSQRRVCPRCLDSVVVCATVRHSNSEQL